jgi:hypothetical protein
MAVKYVTRFWRWEHQAFSLCYPLPCLQYFKRSRRKRYFMSAFVFHGFGRLGPDTGGQINLRPIQVGNFPTACGHEQHEPEQSLDGFMLRFAGVPQSGKGIQIQVVLTRRRRLYSSFSGHRQHRVDLEPLLAHSPVEHPSETRCQVPARRLRQACVADSVHDLNALDLFERRVEAEQLRHRDRVSHLVVLVLASDIITCLYGLCIARYRVLNSLSGQLDPLALLALFQVLRLGIPALEHGGLYFTGCVSRSADTVGAGVAQFYVPGAISTTVWTFAAGCVRKHPRTGRGFVYNQRQARHGSVPDRLPRVLIAVSLAQVFHDCGLGDLGFVGQVHVDKFQRGISGAFLIDSRVGFGLD